MFKSHSMLQKRKKKLVHPLVLFMSYLDRTLATSEQNERRNVHQFHWPSVSGIRVLDL